MQIPYDLATIYGICTGSITDELMDIYSEMCSSFKNIEYQGHVTELDYIENLLITQSLSTNAATDSVYEVMLTATEECLHVIGVSIDPDIPIRLVPPLIRTLLEFDPTDTPETMEAIVNDSEGPVECLCDILEHCTTIDADTWLSVITGAETRVIDAIKHQLSLEINKQDTLNANVPEIIEDMRRKANAVKEVFDDVTLPGIVTESSSLEDLYDLHVGSLVNMSSERAIREILGLSVVSNESSVSMESSLNNVLDDLFYEPSDRIKANRIVSSMRSKIDHLLN